MFKILVVDDNVKNCDIMEDILTTWGFEVYKAFQGMEAVSMAIKRKPDIILLDVMLPGMNGFEVCSKLKNIPETKDIPIIMLTVLSEIEDKIRGFKSGADIFLSKPVNYKELESRINCLLKNKQALETMDTNLNFVKSLLEIMRLKNYETYLHTLKVKDYCEKVGRLLSLDKNNFQNLILGAYLHDIGKMISNSEEEHIHFGEGIVKNLKMFKYIKHFIRNHHERLDGSGYPDKLKEQNMPLELQILITVNRFLTLENEFDDENKGLEQLEREVKIGHFSFNVFSALKQSIEDQKFIKKFQKA